MKVLQGQSLFDIAVQELGSADAAYDIALLNDMSVTDDLVIGQELIMPDPVNKSIATYYSNKNITPATAMTAAQIADTLAEGIEYWGIETEFIIS